MKLCRKCNTEKSIEDFTKDKSRHDGCRPQCRACDKLYAMQNKAKWPSTANDPSKKLFARKRWIKWKYGISLDEYDTLLEQQSNKCAICEETTEGVLYVDHCHDTSKVRGLLCKSCNTGLGHFKDNKKFLTKAIEYLSKE